MDQAAKKTLLRMFNYTLFAVTSAHDAEVSGMTANWVAQASFEPPMIMLAVEADSHSLKVIQASGAFALNVLERGQRELAGQLGRATAKKPDKLVGLATHPGPATGAPILDAALGWLECRVTGSLPAGDHIVVVAEVVEAGVQAEGQPLTMADAGFRYFG
ncbi:MAG: flavin reductase family protein [Anaerolineae bacterium]|nr:flavin reductase family protein [Anaerolineae bacterium]